MFIFSSHQANRLIYSLFLWPLCNCSVDGLLCSCFAIESSVEHMGSADQRCHSLNFSSVNPDFKERKFKLQKLLKIISFFCLLPLYCTVSNAVNCEWERVPHIPVLPSTLCSCHMALAMSPTRILIACANDWVRPEPHRSTLKTTSGKDHLFGDVLPGTRWGSGNPLRTSAPLAAVEEDGGGFSSYWPYIHHQR